MNRLRSIRMSDLLWETLAEVAERNERSVAEEVRIACEQWLRLAANIELEDERVTRSVPEEGSYRQVVREVY
jgi:predicted DNA-binding protein